MAYDKEFIAAKLIRWKKYIQNFKLPQWQEIPDIGLYMEQVITLLKQYLDYLPPDLKEEQFITASTINNYVRTKVMPEPRKKLYYREHIAYLIIILTLKQSLSLSMIQKILPKDLEEENLKEIYTQYVKRHSSATELLCERVEQAAEPLFEKNDDSQDMINNQVLNIILNSAILGGFTRILSEKLILLDGRTTGDDSTT